MTSSGNAQSNLNTKRGPTIKMGSLGKGVLVLILFFVSGCSGAGSDAGSLADGLPESANFPAELYHPLGWKDDSRHRDDFPSNPQYCRACHGDDLRGGTSGISCIPCHHAEETPNFRHGDAAVHITPEHCDGCHGEDLTGGETNTSCFKCHVDRSGCSDCHKMLESHPVHTIKSSRGISSCESTQDPSPLDCEACHDENPLNYATFADDDGYGSTSVCDECHSSGGSYDGVNDAVIGAKANWDNGVYKNAMLQPGKEKWCVGCHDSGISVINGVSAPDVGSFYLTGHGRFKGTVECPACHDSTLTHVDGLARTYVYAGPGQSPADYQKGYRLKLVGGTDYPLAIPKAGPVSEISAADDFRLCLECHATESVFDDTVPYDTNFNNSGDNKAYGLTQHEVNDHRSHVLNEFGHWYDYEELWDSDWDATTGNATRGGADSNHSCVTCHNVHGSAYPAMIRDGKLVGRTRVNGWAFDGLEFSYVRDDGFPNVTSQGAAVSNSVGGVMRLTAKDNPPEGRICYMVCHTDNPATEPNYTAELGDPSPSIIGCLICHDEVFSDAINYFRQPSGD